MNAICCQTLLVLISIIFNLLFDSKRHRDVLVQGKHDKCEYHRYELFIIFRHSNNVQKISGVITMKKKKSSKVTRKNYNRMREMKRGSEKSNLNKTRGTETIRKMRGHSGIELQI
ncbi:hypothetical protein COJ56_00155 [Bacillus thuringiensis]|nr:hypothetical protein COJ56_00155 [Bacillus thuringiensis]RFB51677.1 hypothetical protein DZB90_30055 [Bacillus thuringiensis]